MKGFERMRKMKINHGLHPPTPRLRRAGRQAALTLAIVGMALTAAADPGITVSARQRYPWNGLVDINFTITGESGTKYDTSFAAKDMVGNTNIAMRTIHKADGTAAVATEQLLPGTYSWVWDAAADLPKDFKCDRMTVTATADISAFPYTVKFNANGGTGSMANQSFTYGTEQALTANAFTRTGYMFQGWATSAGGAKVYNDKQSVSNLTQTSGAVVNLYAVWDHEKVQLWANGPYWAAMNIGASKVTASGYFFWWGDTIGYKRQSEKWVARDGSSSNFSFISGNAPTYGKSIDTLKSQGWITTDNTLAPEHDAAHVIWRGNWRLPTINEMKNLDSKCTWTWMRKDGVDGYLVSGEGAYANNSIFLPCAGYAYENYIANAGGNGGHWSSVPSSGNNNSMSIYFNTQEHGTSNFTRYYGRPIRAVCSP